MRRITSACSMSAINRIVWPHRGHDSTLCSGCRCRYVSEGLATRSTLQAVCPEPVLSSARYWPICKFPHVRIAGFAPVEATGDGNFRSVANREAARCLRCDMDFERGAPGTATASAASHGAKCHK